MLLLLLVTENGLLQDLKRWIFSVETFINFWLSENYFKISFLSFQMPLFSLRSIMITEKQDEMRKVLIRGVKSKGTWSWMRSHPRETRNLHVQSLLLPSHPSPGCVKDWEKRESKSSSVWRNAEQQVGQGRPKKEALVSPENCRAICLENSGWQASTYSASLPTVEQRLFPPFFLLLYD